jgi:hypothetical protein
MLEAIAFRRSDSLKPSTGKLSANVSEPCFVLAAKLMKPVI